MVILSKDVYIFVGWWWVDELEDGGLSGISIWCDRGKRNEKLINKIGVFPVRFLLSIEKGKKKKKQIVAKTLQTVA